MAKSNSPALVITAAHSSILAGILAGNVSHVGKTDEVTALVGAGYIEVDPNQLDNNGNAAVRLTETGKAEAEKSSPATNQGAAGGVSFVMQAVPLPGIKRGGAGGESRYPLKTIPIGQAMFVPNSDGDAKSKGKQFGSMVAEFNKTVDDRHLTTRTIRDGKAAGFVGQNADGTPNPDAFDGVAGIGIWAIAGKAPPKAEKTA